MNRITSRTARRAVCAASLATVLAAPALHAQAVSAYHDADLATHLSNEATLSGQGYRPIDITIYGTNANPLFAAVWVQRAGPAFQVFENLTAAQYQNLINANCANWSLQSLSVMGTAGNPRFAGIFEQSNSGCYARHGLDSDGLNDEITLARDGGWRIASVDVYGTSGDTRYAVSFEPNPEGFAQGYFYANGTNGYQSLSEAMDQHWAHCRHIGFNDDSSRFLPVWEDSSVGNWVTHHDMTAAQYQTQFDTYAQSNWYPIEISASGNGSSRRFAAVWAGRDLPRTRQWSMSGQAVPELFPFDVWVQNHMQTTGTRAAALAVVKDGELKLARGYTWAEAGYPQTQPTSRFRIASCTKPLTSILMHRAFQNDPGVSPGSLMGGFFGNPNFADNRSQNITVDHLLSHRGGWDRTENGSNYDPMFIDTTVSSSLGVPLPIDTTDIRTYMQGRFLDFTPGTDREYSNYGFSLLGRILELRNPGKTYQQVLQQQIFSKLGITRAVIGGSLRNQKLNDEVEYHPGVLGIARSVRSDSRPWVASIYGGWNQENFDSHGAHVMSAPDFAKVLGAFDMAPFNPLLGTPWTDHMWSDVAGNGSWRRGWFRTSGNTATGTVEINWHNGALSGTRTLVARRRDGISFVLFTNSDATIGSGTAVALSDVAESVRAWPSHDLFPSVGLPGFETIDDLMAPYGSSCPSTAGTPRFTTGGSAVIGSRMTMQVSNAPAGVPAFLVLGLGRLNLDLRGLGAPGCSKLVDDIDAVSTITGRSGTADQTFSIPLDPSLVGNHLFAQWFLLDSAANSLGLVGTNGVDVRFGGVVGD